MIQPQIDQDWSRTSYILHRPKLSQSRTLLHDAHSGKRETLILPPPAFTTNISAME